MNAVLRPFQLKPYDDKLVDGVVDGWLVFVRLNMFSIAFCDSVAWAYWAHVTAAGAAGYATAAVAALIVFFVVASVDASFVMHDATGHRAAPVLTTRSWMGKTVRWIQNHLRRAHFAIFFRIILVVISFTVTAPFLTQFFFSRDIAAAIVRNNESAQASKRTQIAANYDQMLTATRMKVAARMGDLEKEVAGSGSSGRYGDGPTASTIRRDITQFENDVANIEKARAAELGAFDRAAPEDLANRYGIDFKREGPDTRAHVVAEMEKSPAFRNMRNNIKWFLAFMFLALLTLKFFQPDAVKHYYSADLQAAHEKYEAGLYDANLDARERSGEHAMTPPRFVRWYFDHQHDLEESERLQNRVAHTRAKVEAQNQGFETIGGTISTDLEKMHADLDSAKNAKNALDQQCTDARARLATLQAKIRHQEQELAEFSYDIDANNDVSLRDSDFIVRRKQVFDRQLSDNRAAVLDAESLIANLNQQLDDNRVLRENIDASINSRGQQAADLMELRNATTRRSMEDIASVG